MAEGEGYIMPGDETRWFVGPDIRQSFTYEYIILDGFDFNSKDLLEIEINNLSLSRWRLISVCSNGRWHYFERLKIE